jgi:hypothetical protein
MRWQLIFVIARSESDEAIETGSAETFWIAHMGMECVKAVGQLFVRWSALCSIAGQLFVPTMGRWKMARADRVKVGPQGRREAA